MSPRVGFHRQTGSPGSGVGPKKSINISTSALCSRSMNKGQDIAPQSSRLAQTSAWVVGTTANDGQGGYGFPAGSGGVYTDIPIE